jgi:hypothetical protein
MVDSGSGQYLKTYKKREAITEHERGNILAGNAHILEKCFQIKKKEKILNISITFKKIFKVLREYI